MADQLPNDSDLTDQPVVVEDPQTTPPVLEADQAIQPAPTVTETPMSAPQSSHKRRNIIIAVAVVLLLAIGGVGFLMHTHSKKDLSSSQKQPAKTATKKPITEIPSFASDLQDVPSVLGTRPNLFKDYGAVFGADCTDVPAAQINDDYSNCPPSVTASDMVYYQIGKTKAGQPIIVADNGAKGEAERAYIALQTGSGSYAILGKFSYEFRTGADQSAITAFRNALDASTTLDLATDLPDLAFPDSLTVKGTPFKIGNGVGTGYYAGYLMNGLANIRGSYRKAVDLKDITKIGNDGARSIYSVIAQSSANYAVKEIYLADKNVYVAAYTPDDSLNSSSTVPKITWSDGTTNKDNYSFSSGGCGSAYGYITAKNLTESSLTKVGIGPNGQTLYALPTTSGIFGELYNTDYAGGADLDNVALHDLTTSQFQASHGVFVAKNGLGEWVIYKDGNLFQGGGCGKPVVYLYPTNSQLVNVAVGADVVKSEPTYTTGGWRNVLAQPNGQLSYQGKIYSSLYWEGVGNGLYPLVTSGTVVRSSQAVSTIRAQLKEQGFNTQETSDFLAYWAPRLPTTAYIRLTWFNTQQMNELAPLTISPKPATVIRTFLDFQGLNQPIAMPAQHFSAPARNGFTVVEWGGLVRDSKY